MRGILNIDKPAGQTSHDVVSQVRRLSRVKRTGHAGTLDPDATGVLLVCIGEATRLAEYLADAGKGYQALLSLGRTTFSQDASGETLSVHDASHIAEDDILRVLPQFIGDIFQVPPMVSALHHEGQRLYTLARQGMEVERAARPIRIDAIELTDFQSGTEPTAALQVRCGKGTYIRTLCADIGDALGVGGHMAALRRTQVGAFSVSTSVPLADLDRDNIAVHLTSPADALADLPMLSISAMQIEDVRHGRAISSENDSLRDDMPVGLLSCAGDLVALARPGGGTLHPFKVFAE